GSVGELDLSAPVQTAILRGKRAHPRVGGRNERAIAGPFEDVSSRHVRRCSLTTRRPCCRCGEQWDVRDVDHAFRDFVGAIVTSPEKVMLEAVTLFLTCRFAAFVRYKHGVEDQLVVFGGVYDPVVGLHVATA